VLEADPVLGDSDLATVLTREQVERLRALDGRRE
jgi:hypothetical protein